jgi:repressor LexA
MRFAEPTARQVEVLEGISLLTGAHGFPPSVRDLCALLGISSTNGVREHLDALERRGLVKRMERVARSLVLTDSGRLLLAGVQ